MIKALCFDVIGTVVDWRGTIVSDLEFLANRHGYSGDWCEFARKWASFYASDGFKTIAELRDKGGLLLAEYGLIGETADEQVDLEWMAGAWIRLRPYSDVLPAMDHLRNTYRLCTLTNCRRSVMASLSHNVNLCWDQVLSARDAGAKKPDPAVYRYACRALDLPAEQIMMVAAHSYDLRAAKREGFCTAFIQRGEGDDPAPDDGFDLVVKNLWGLAEGLGV